MDKLVTLCIRITESDYKKLASFIVWGRVRKKSDVARLAIAIGLKLIKRYGYEKCWDAVYRYNLDDSKFIIIPR